MPTVLLLIILILLPGISHAQAFGFNFSSKQKKVKIPFELYNNFIIVKGRINDIVPVQFILDTGSRHIIITRREYGAFMNIIPGKAITIMGADRRSRLNAALATDVSIDLGRLESRYNSVLILEEDVFQLDKIVGKEIHGILGSEFFGRHILKIDYRRRMLTLYPRDRFEKPSSYTPLALTVERQKPFLQTRVIMEAGDTINLSLLLDTGADLPVLFYSDVIPGFDMPSQVIPSNIGRGLGGYLEGYLGRIRKLAFGPYHFDYPPAHFQELNTAADSLSYAMGHGILGGDLLSRFRIILDYSGKTIYLKAKKNYNKDLSVDLSGLLILAGGEELDRFLIYDVLEGSPAEKAGIRKNDVLYKLNFRQHKNLDLEDIHRILQSREGRKIRVVVQRDGELIKYRFRLRNYLAP